MELSRFHRAIHQIASDYKVTNTELQLTSLLNHLTSLVANPGNAQVSQAFKDHLESLRQSLMQSELNSADGELLEVLRDQGLINFVGNHLFLEVKKILDANQLTPNLAAPEIEKLRAETSRRLNLVASIDSAFTELEVEYRKLNDGETEMLVDLPMEEETKTLKDLAKESKDWHQICRAVAETFDPDQSRITIRSITSGSILLYLAGTITFIFGMAKCLKGVNQILAEVIKMKNLYAQLIESKVPASISQEFEKHNNGKAKTDLEKLAADLVDEYYTGNDQGRKNELKTSLSISLTRLSQKLATGTTVTLRLAKPKKPKIDEGEEPSQEKLSTLKEVEKFEKVQIEVNASKAALDYRQHAQELMAALPAPAVDEQASR